MYVTLTATYDSTDKLRNAEDDLRGTGIPSEKILVDKDAKQIKVIAPEDTKNEYIELLRRHGPATMT